MPFLIDGHNVIAALPDIDLDDPYDEAKLILKLRQWAGHERRQATVVFDGGVPGGHSRALSGGGLEVVFAARKHTIADRIIQARLRRLRDAANWTVVSSDKEVIDSARAAGARTMSAQEFAARLARPTPTPPEKPQRISPDEVQEWLAIFGAGKDANTERGRSTRTIGEQLGFEPPATPGTPAADHPAPQKHTSSSAAEIEHWLEVFPEPVEPASPPATSPTPVAKKQRHRKAAPAINKENPEALSNEELAAWEALFPEVAVVETPTDSSQPPAQSRHTAKRSQKLDRHRKQQLQEAQLDTPELSQDDLETWYRLFGEEPDP